MYSWISANIHQHPQNNNNSNDIIVKNTLNLDEMSAQKATACNINSNIDEEEKEEDCILNASQELYLFGKKYIVESSSALCYGLEEAMKRFISSLIYDNYKDHNKTLQTSIINPCLSQNLAQYSTVSKFFVKKSDIRIIDFCKFVIGN